MDIDPQQRIVSPACSIYNIVQNAWSMLCACLWRLHMFVWFVYVQNKYTHKKFKLDFTSLYPVLLAGVAWQIVWLSLPLEYPIYSLNIPYYSICWTTNDRMYTFVKDQKNAAALLPVCYMILLIFFYNCSFSQNKHFSLNAPGLLPICYICSRSFHRSVIRLNHV